MKPGQISDYYRSLSLLYASLAEASAASRPRRFGPTSRDYFIHLALKVQKLEAKLNEGGLAKRVA